MSFIYYPFNWFIARPWLVEIPGAILLAASILILRGKWQHHAVVGGALLVASLSWFGYGLYEYAIKLAYPSESIPIRVDLLLIAPVQWLITTASVLFGIAGWWLHIDEGRSEPRRE